MSYFDILEIATLIIITLAWVAYLVGACLFVIIAKRRERNEKLENNNKTEA